MSIEGDAAVKPEIMRSIEGLEPALREFLAWADAQFGTRPKDGRWKLAHLAPEIVELIENPVPDEFVDCLGLLVHAAACYDIRLAEAIRQKLPLLRARRWNRPDANGVVEHVREP